MRERRRQSGAESRSPSSQSWMLHCFCHLHNSCEEAPVSEQRAGEPYTTVTLMPVNASAAPPADPGTVSYLGRGIYDICEVARLLCRGRTMVEGWTRSRCGTPPLLTGELRGLFSFWDLVSLRVVAELRRRGVPRDHIARGAKHLERALGTDRPFAHEALATVGTGFFADVAGEWEDAGLGGQLAFQATVQPLLKPITFNDDKMASIWRPHESVWRSTLKYRLEPHASTARGSRRVCWPGCWTSRNPTSRS